MVPTMILAGLAVGFAAGRSWQLIAFGAMLGCVLFGIAIGLDRSSLSDGAVGFAVAIPNVIAGLLLWTGGSWLRDRVRATTEPQ